MTGTGLDHSFEGVALVGAALSPFFLNDPRLGKAATSFEALHGLDTGKSSLSWPFVDDDAARTCLMRMKGSISGMFSQDGSFHADDELVLEYRHLFTGPGKLACPPWGSVYTDRDQVIFGKTCLELQEWMRASGISRLSDDGMPPDHIGTMLSCMEYLARHRGELLDTFLSEHFLSWAPHFLDLLEKTTRHDFYKGLAELTRLSLEGISKSFHLEIRRLRFYR